MPLPLILTPRTDPKIADSLVRAARHWKGPSGIHTRSNDYRVLDLDERVQSGLDASPEMEVVHVMNRNEMGVLELCVIVNRELCDSPAALKAIICRMLDSESERLIGERREQRRLVC